jgi:proteasome lid subunit RPN8/RPN11
VQPNTKTPPAKQPSPNPRPRSPRNLHPRNPSPWNPKPYPWSAQSRCPLLRFTPYAWAKLHYFCHAGDTEIGGFGLTDATDSLLVLDFLTVRQQVTSVSVEFDDEAVAQLFDDQIDAGRRPQQFARIWCHTHPGDSPHPSGVDEETFDRVFRGCDWSVMFILACGGPTYARLRFNTGPGGDLEIPVAVDYRAMFPASAHEAWQQAYTAHIQLAMRASAFDLYPDDGSKREGNPACQLGYHLWEDGAWEEAEDLGLAAACDADDLEHDRELIEMLMDEYGVSDTAALRSLLQHENESLRHAAEIPWDA